MGIYILLGYIAFMFCFFFVGTLVIECIGMLCTYAYEKLNELFFPVKKLSDEEVNEIYREASDFVHSKHRPWDFDDGFAEFLWVTNELFKDRNYLKNN